jgi:alkylation response protein AidB-like acyl-CoA dehydrogenase
MPLPRTVYDDDHRLFRESVAAFVDREILPRREAIREARRIPKQLWLKAGEMGFLGLAIPEEHGGSDVASATTRSSTRSWGGPAWPMRRASRSTPTSSRPTWCA